MSGKARSIAAALAVSTLGLLSAAPASADHHLMQIREVGAGTDADPMDEFVELQMYASGQNFVQGHYLNMYGANGDSDGQYPFPTSPSNGGDQRTILIGGPNFAGTEDFTQDMNITGGGGAVCFMSTLVVAIDCVSWGNYDGDPAPPSPTGTNVAAGGIPESQSIVRRITAGCPTALDPADDTNNSAVDFAVQATPTPQNNSVTPTETVCVPPVAAPPAVPSAGTPGKKKRVRRCKKKPSKNAAAVAKKKRCKKKK